MTETVKARVQRIMADSDPHRKGRSFEEFLARHLKDIPDAEVARAWRWSAVPPEIRRHAVSSAHGGQDFGIDVLAVRNDGGFIAVQAKAYAKTALTKSDVQKFLAASNLHQALTHRWIVATGKVTDPVRTMVGAQCSIINPLVAWGDVILPEVGSRPTLKPDAIQRRAIGDCVTGLGNAGEGHDRGRLIMACGLGKTLVSQRIAEQIAFEGNRAAPLVLYATPSISLTAQSRRSWLRNSECGLQTVVVCSDKDAGRHYDESVAEFVEAPVSTAPEAIAKSLTAMIGRAKGKMTAVFCTYQSIDKVIEAQQIANVTVDFAVADEAHNTTGNIGGGGGVKRRPATSGSSITS